MYYLLSEEADAHKKASHTTVKDHTLKKRKPYVPETWHEVETMMRNTQLCSMHCLVEKVRLASAAGKLSAPLPMRVTSPRKS